MFRAVPMIVTGAPGAFLYADARRGGQDDLAAESRTRALGTAAVTGVVGLAGLFVLRIDAPALFDGLTGRALPVLVISVLAGLTAIAFVVAWRYQAARPASAAAVATILVGWAAAQYPYVLDPTLTPRSREAARGRTTLRPCSSH